MQKQASKSWTPWIHHHWPRSGVSSQLLKHPGGISCCDLLLMKWKYKEWHNNLCCFGFIPMTKSLGVSVQGGNNDSSTREFHRAGSSLPDPVPLYSLHGDIQKLCLISGNDWTAWTRNLFFFFLPFLQFVSNWKAREWSWGEPVGRRDLDLARFALAAPRCFW